METITDRIVLIMGELNRRTGLTATEFAARIGVSKSAVSKWQSGATSDLRSENLFAIEDGFGYSARWLATGVPPMMAREAREKQAEYLIRRKIETGDLLDLEGLDGPARAALKATAQAFEDRRPRQPDGGAATADSGGATPKAPMPA